MDDPILHAIEHPPRGDAPRDPALTAAVMGRVRALPTPLERRRTRVQWLAAGALAAVIAAGLFLVPPDLVLAALAGMRGAEAAAGDGILAVSLVAILVIAVAARGRPDAA